MMEDTFGHSPIKKMFDQRDVYGVAYDPQRAARKPVRLGIIGAGGVARSKYIPAINRLSTIWEPVELTAVCCQDEQVGRQIEALTGARWYGDASKMLADAPLDGVLVCGPDELHVEHALACVERGLPVLVEKPIARSLADALRLCDEAERRKVPLLTVANKRFSPPYRRAKQFVENGPLKNPAMFCGKFNLGYDYVDLLEQGTVHLIDLMLWFMGPATQVHAAGINQYARNKTGYPADNIAITVRFVGGSIASLYTASSALSLKPWERVEIYGDKAWLAVEDQCELILHDSEEGGSRSWKPVIPNTLLFDEEFGGFMGILEHFLQVIRGAEPPAVTGRDGYRALELCVAIRRSLERDEVIKLPLPSGESE